MLLRPHAYSNSAKQSLKPIRTACIWEGIPLCRVLTTIVHKVAFLRAVIAKRYRSPLSAQCSSLLHQFDKMFSTPTATGFAVNAASLVSSVLILYDHFLTSSREVDYVWRSKMTASTAVFYGGRYSALAYSVFGILEILFWNDYASCVAINVIPQILMIFILLMWSMFSTLRAYAISGHNLYATLCVGLLALASFSCVTFITANLRFNRVLSSIGSCSSYVTFAQNLETKFSTAARVCLIASESTVLVILVVCIPRADHILKRSLAARMRRNGLLYFAIMVVLNILDAIMFAKGVFYDVFPSFTSPLSLIIISRFFLDLREQVDQPINESQMPTLQFTHTVQAPSPSTETGSCTIGQDLQDVHELALEC